MLLTVDIGTSTFKSALWNFEGEILSSFFYPLTVKNEGIKHEAEPALWLNAFEYSLKQLSLNLNLKNLIDVKAVIISGNGPSLVPVLGSPDNKNRLYVPAKDAMLWLDRRAVNYQKIVSDVMGGFVDAGFFLPKILYIKNEDNELYNKTKCFIGCPEYLAYALTGEAKTVFPCGGFDRWFWNNDVLDSLDLNQKKFPEFIQPGGLFGEISGGVCDLLGFAHNTPVISGGPDFFAAILGSGVTKPGEACDRSGSSEGINLCTKNHINDIRLMSYRHPVKPFWNLSGIINTTGKAIEWGSGILGFSGFDEFIKGAKESKKGSGGLIFNPYLMGERSPLWNPSVRAVWSGIDISTKRNDFANSILEGISFAIKDVINVMEETGEKISELRATGKLSACGYLNQIKADITGISVISAVNKEAELSGLAIIGTAALGVYSSYEDACLKIIKKDKIYEPDLKNTELYNNLFYKYQQNKEKN